MAQDVFLSVGGTANDEQEHFVQAIENRLRSEGLNPKTVGRNTFSVDAPLKTVENLMQQCVGVVVLALERSFFSEGLEKRGGNKEKLISNISIPTPWNHIEAAMGYTRGLPLLVIVQEGLKDEGLLERGYDWHVQRVPLDESYLSSPQFNGVLASWRAKIDSDPNKRGEASVASPMDPGEMPVGQIIGMLKPSQFWACIVALAALVAGASTLGAKLF